MNNTFFCARENGKLHRPRTILTGFGFMASSIAWAIYDPYITKILERLLNASSVVTQWSAKLNEMFPVLAKFAESQGENVVTEAGGRASFSLNAQITSPLLASISTALLQSSSNGILPVGVLSPSSIVPPYTGMHKRSATAQIKARILIFFIDSFLPYHNKYFVKLYADAQIKIPRTAVRGKIYPDTRSAESEFSA